MFGSAIYVLDALHISVHQLELRLSSVTSPRPPLFRSHLPNPPRYDGKQLTLCTWLPSIRAKFQSDQLAGADAFDYMWDRLEQPQRAACSNCCPDRCPNRRPNRRPDPHPHRHPNRHPNRHPDSRPPTATLTA
ncbi:hypothetical protein EJ02DRAFT_187315 [Clathrospora elynae]|uniref:Uncharacterized protein n=1 Tax=Clathrospora elynae TaxID=706981 RepID=A0A6A5S3A0_9PLEO|nr:hypothetical protein EJ02DRAFT_187315 [Clathrospora elynae]